MPLNRQITTNKGKPESREMKLTAKDDIEVDGETLSEGESINVSKSKAKRLLKQTDGVFDVDME